MKLAVCALALAGCYDPDPLYCPSHGSDAVNCPRVASDSGSADCHDISALGFTECLVTPPTAPVQIGMNTTFDTGTGMSNPPGLACAMLDSTSSEACVLAGTTVTISAGATLFVTGTKPLALAADTSIDISGTLDVASHSATKGPAADSSACVAGTAATGGGGGAGGSFGTQGGTGGDQYQANASRATPGAVQTATTLRGGCAGSQGSSPPGIGGSSTPGSGGGAVALLAQTITISGAIDASGAGGGGGHDAGGGGGGAGGMIALSAMSIALTGRVWANGGHGGGGSNGQDGAAGSDPDGPTSGGGGGNGGNPAGDGASGYPSPTTNGSPGTGNVPIVNIGAGGGGGGGGAGTIMTFGTTAISGPSVSPPSK